ncbi:MAG TPA: hypothetical protein VGO62_04975 [Myxococcota bacterium]|jgi:DNA-binding transcriptional regulator GbsR (MarR family)
MMKKKPSRTRARPKTKSRVGARVAVDGADGLAGTRTSLGDGFARMCALYGVNPLLGRLYALLMLSPEPASLEALAHDAGVARSSASVAMRRLVDACVVRRLPARSDRRDYYEAIVDTNELMRGWWQRYFEPELRIWREVLEATRRDLDEQRGDARIRARVDHFADFASEWEGVLRRMFSDVGDVEGSARASASRRIAVEFVDARRGGSDAS